LKVGKDHARLDYGKPAVIFVNDALDVVQLVSGEDDPAKCDAPADRSRARP
jgi:hypothetical protein